MTNIRNTFKNKFEIVLCHLFSKIYREIFIYENSNKSLTRSGHHHWGCRDKLTETIENLFIKKKISLSL